MEYSLSEHWTARAREIAQVLGFTHVLLDRLVVVESFGTKTKHTVARVHSLGKVMQLGMNQKPFYVIELISERFSRISDDEKVKTIIHELMHIPHSFGGGFRHHNPYVTTRTVEAEFLKYKALVK